jgi:hypothetical protein
VFLLELYIYLPCKLSLSVFLSIGCMSCDLTLFIYVNVQQEQVLDQQDTNEEHRPMMLSTNWLGNAASLDMSPRWILHVLDVIQFFLGAEELVPVYLYFLFLG